MTETQEPDREALLKQMMERRARTHEIFRRAQTRPGPGITDADIEAEFERVRKLLGPPKPPEPPVPLSPEQVAQVKQQMKERRARMQEIFRRAQTRPGPGITDADIEAEFERVRKQLAKGGHTNDGSPLPDLQQSNPEGDPGDGRGRIR